MKSIFVNVLVIGILLGCQSNPDANTSLSEATSELLSNLTVDDHPSIAVVPFTDTETGQTNQLGSYLAGDVVYILSNNYGDRVRVVEREQIAILLSELEINAFSGLISDDEAKQVGEMTGADFLVIGSILMVDNSLQLNMRIVDVEKGQIRGASKALVPFTAEYRTAAGQNEFDDNRIVVAEPPNESDVSEVSQISAEVTSLPDVSTNPQSTEIPRLSYAGATGRISPVDIPWSRLPVMFSDPPGNHSDGRPSSDILAIQFVHDGEYLNFAVHTAGPVEEDETWYQFNVYTTEDYSNPDADIDIVFQNGRVSSFVRAVVSPENREVLWRVPLGR